MKNFSYILILMILVLITACTPIDKTNLNYAEEGVRSKGISIDYTKINMSIDSTANIGDKTVSNKNNIQTSSNTFYSVIYQPSPSKFDTLKIELQVENYNNYKNVSLVGTMNVPKGYTGHFEFNSSLPNLIRFYDGFKPNITWTYATKYIIVEYNETDENETNTTYIKKVYSNYSPVANLSSVKTEFFDKEAYLDPDVTGCGLINSAGVYNLTNLSIINYAGTPCINITSSNVVFDCMGATIDGKDTYNYYGISIMNNPATLTNVTIKNCIINDFDCINLLNVQSSFFQNIWCNSSYDGGINAFQQSNSYNNFYNVNVTNNYERGYSAIITGGSNNNFSNILLKNVGKGVQLSYNNRNNLFVNSSIINSSGVAIYYSSNSISNNVFSNVFINTSSFYLASSATSNFYNTTSYAGINIIGGSIIGGNFWGKPNRTGYSDTCIDSDVNGICDVPFNVTSQAACSGCKGYNIDEMPLTYLTGAPPVYPQITNIQDNNGSFINSGIADINSTITQTNGTGYVNIDGLKYYMTNVSSFFNASIPLTGGVYAYNITAYGNGTDHLLNSSSVRYFTVNQTDTVYPYIINVTDNNATLVNNGTGTFHADVFNTNGSVYLNFSGTSYLMSNISYAYFYNLTVTSGVYYYSIWALGNGTSHNFNQTTSRVYQVNTSDTIFPLFGDETSNNATMYADGIANFSIPVNNTNNSVYLNINGNRYHASNTSNVYNVSLFLTNGTYPHYWDAFGNGSNNNSNVSVTRFFVIFPIQQANATLKLNGLESNVSGTYNFLINASFTNQSGNATLYRDGIIISSLNNQNQNLSAGYYNYTLQVEGNHDYLGLNLSRFANVSKATPVITKALNGVDANLFVTYPTLVTPTGNTSYGNLTIYMDNVEVVNGDPLSLPVNVYLFDWRVIGDENYSDVNASLTATVNPVGTIGNDMVIHNFWGSDPMNRICFAFYKYGSETCFNETEFVQDMNNANWSQSAATLLFLGINDQRYNDTGWVRSNFYNQTASDVKYAILEANNIFSGNNTFNGNKLIINTNTVEFGVTNNVTITSGDLIVDHNLYVGGNLTYTAQGSLSVNNSICVFDLSGDCQINLSVTGVNGNIWLSNNLNASGVCLQGDSCLTNWQSLNQTSALASVGNWTLDKTSYSTTAQISNATIIRVLNTSWVVATANASGNIYNWNSTGYIKDWNGLVNSTSWNRTGTNVILANTADKVGIGTSTPTAIFEVKNASGSVMFNITETTIKIGPGHSITEGSWNLDPNGLIEAAVGSTTNPGFRFLSDQDVGMYSGGTNILNFSTGAITRVSINNGTQTIYLNGKVGIGTTTPNYTMEVKGVIATNNSLYQPVYGSDDDLVLYYPFSEDSAVISTEYDRSPSGNDAINSTHAGVGVYACNITYGKFGSGCDFNNQSLISNDNGLLGTSDWSVLFWSKLHSVRGAYISQGTLSSCRWSLQTGGSAGLSLIMTNSSGAVTSFPAIPYNFSLEQWYSIAMIVDRSNSTIEFFVDGNSIGSYNISPMGPGNLGGAKYFIAQSPYGNADRANLSIDEVKVYNRKLSNQEIVAQYLQGANPQSVMTTNRFMIMNTSLNTFFYINSTISYINTTGNLGIGTSTPSQKLEVAGTSNFIGDVYIANASYFQASTNKTWLGTSQALGGNKLGVLNFPYNQKNAISLHSNSTGGLIGQGSDNAIAIAENWNFETDSVARYYWNVSSVIELYGNGGTTGKGIVFSTTNSSVNNSLLERMRINSAGLVGIGTASPTALLTVNGSESSPNGDNAAIAIKNSGATDQNQQWLLRAGGVGTNTPDNGFSIADKAAYRLTITSGGEVGIGTTTPSSALTVVGDANFTRIVGSNGSVIIKLG